MPVTSQSRRLVIVESPTKAASIARFLGDGYIVESSVGHIRDLPQNAAQIPAKYKGEKWARTGVDVEHEFEPLYVVTPRQKETLKRLKLQLAKADELYLATDEDREGEAIAWHLLAELKPKIPVKRMVFHEITPAAIQAAVENPRELDYALVDAQETRRILDRLVGYEVSPVLWKKIKPRISAGRVQSVATRLIVDRELERMAFKSASYWSLEAVLDAGAAANPREFAAKLSALDSVSIATGSDFDSTGELKNKAILLTEGDAKLLATELSSAIFKVSKVETRAFTKRPAAPFRTTTLQQEAGRKLRFSADRTMKVAQALYEGGFITYMRTDSVNLSSQAITAARAAATERYGSEYVTGKPRTYASKVKSAQEAHEAIRPAGDFFRSPDELNLIGDQAKLYDLIWRRTLASQMADAKGETLSVQIDGAKTVTLSSGPISTATFSASGTTITFPGFQKAYEESVDDDDEKKSPKLPLLSEGAAVQPVNLESESHETRPPARYTEPSLVAKLEELEIGRPSTYASIINTITSRDYVYKKGSALVPTWLAFAVTNLLVHHFTDMVDYDFTAEMEGKLDAIAAGDLNRLFVLNEFYFGDDANDGLQKLVTDLGDIDSRALCSFAIGTKEQPLTVRVWKDGASVEDDKGRRASIPEDLAPADLTPESAEELLSRPAEDRVLGIDPVTGNQLQAKNGRYGPYVTEVLEVDPDLPKSKQPKPRTAGLLSSMDLTTLTLDDALKLLTLPRVVGVDADGVQITAHNGPRGPYLKRGNDNRSLDNEDQLFSLTLDEALEVYAKPKTFARSSAELKDLGEDPTTGKLVRVMNGRFGPYVTDGETNATLRKADSHEAMTIERASELLAEKRLKNLENPKPAKKTTRRTTKTATRKKA